MEIALAWDFSAQAVEVVDSESFESGIWDVYLAALPKAGLIRDLVGLGRRNRYRVDALEIKVWSCVEMMDDAEKKLGRWENAGLWNLHAHGCGSGDDRRIPNDRFLLEMDCEFVCA